MCLLQPLRNWYVKRDVHLRKISKQAYSKKRKERYVASSTFLFSLKEANIAYNTNLSMHAPAPRAPESKNEERVLGSSGTKDRGHVDPTHQPSKEITRELDDDDGQKKGGRKITQKANIYSRLDKPKIQIPLNELGQPIGADATEFANFIGTLVRKHIPPAELDWRDVDEEKKLLVWETLREWKADLKKSKFDAALIDEELMKRRDDRISEADWMTLIEYWRSPEFEAHSARAKENRAKSTVPHTAGNKSHACVTQEMADELGYTPQRDEVYIKTHTRKKGGYVPQAEKTIKYLIDVAGKHPDWKEKSIREGDLFARVCGMKEPRGRVRVLGLGPTPQDVGTPGTRGKMSTRVLVEMEARRQAEQGMNTMEEQMQQMQEQLNQMKGLMLASQGGHNLETPSSQQGSNSRQNSRVEPEKDNDGEEDGDEEIYVHRRVVASPPPPKKAPQPGKMKALLVWMCFYMHGLVQKILLLRQQFSQSIMTLLWAGCPLGRTLMRLLSMFRLEGTLRCLISMMVYDMSAMLSQGPLHGHLAS